MRVRGLDEVSNIDELLASNLVTDAWTDTILGRVVSNSCVLLKHSLHVSKSLDLVGELTESRNTRCIQQMVLKDSELGRIWQRV